MPSSYSHETEAEADAGLGTILSTDYSADQSGTDASSMTKTIDGHSGRVSSSLMASSSRRATPAIIRSGDIDSSTASSPPVESPQSHLTLADAPSVGTSSTSRSSAT